MLLNGISAVVAVFETRYNTQKFVPGSISSSLERSIENFSTFMVLHDYKPMKEIMTRFRNLLLKLYGFQPSIILNQQPLTVDKHPKYLGIVLDPEILKYGCPIYCRASESNLQKLERVKLSADRIITGLRNSCPNDIVLYEADMQPLELRRSACLVKYYNKLYCLGSRNRTSAFLKVRSNNQRLKREVHSVKCSLPIISLVLWNNTRHCFKLTLEKIDVVPGEAVQMFTDGSKNDRDCSSNGIYIKYTDQEIHLQWILSHFGIEDNEIADTLAKTGASEPSVPTAPLTYLEIFSRAKSQN
ncbi:RNase H domain-containing protein [Nephila pilipes]|uniref:RNase H domain-containing protein n=1 Tax=Nephila pilipes TaxID=299642 RepID=A0A8X6MZH3_NEPPI|nr:RNase H domain-containing protein [Nephila pilipes]